MAANGEIVIVRRRTLLFGLLVVALVFGAAWLLWPRMAISCENAAKIKQGMTLAEVETLLGGGERLDTTGPTEPDTDHHRPDAEQVAAERYEASLVSLEDSRRSQMGSSMRTWASDRVAIFVVFDATERVAAFAVHPLRRAPESLLAMLRRWLHL